MLFLLWLSTGVFGLKMTCVSGGTNDSNGTFHSVTTECYNQSASLWEVIPWLSLPTGNYAMTPINLGSISCLVGGIAFGMGVICTNWSGPWVTMPSIPNSRVGASALYDTNWVGITTGWDGTNLFDSTPSNRTTDPATLSLTWSTASSMEPRQYGTTVNLNGTICVSGGQNQTVPFISISSCLTQDVWVPAVPLNIPRYGSTPFLLDGQWCLAGGSKSFGNGLLNSIECVASTANFQTTSYTLINYSLPVPSYFGTNVSLYGLSCMAGGYTIVGAIADVWCVNISEQNSVQGVQMSSLTSLRYWHASWALDDGTASPTLAPTFSPTLAPTFSPTLAPTFSPTLAPTFSPTLEPTFSPTLAPTFSPTLLPALSPTESPTTSPTPALPTTPQTLSPTSVSPTSSALIHTGKASGLTGGEIAGIVIPLLLLLLGGILCICYFRNNKMKRLASRIKGESREPRDPREVALEGTIKLCEQALKEPKLTAQHKLFLQSIIAGVKEDQRASVQVGVHSGVEMTLKTSEVQQQGLKEFNMEEFEHLRFLSQGEGGSADLYKEKATNHEVVIKVPHHADELAAEAKVWCSIGLHPNVARMIGIAKLNDKPRGIVMEYYPGGSLNSTAQEFSSNELFRIAIDLARGLQCLHKHKVIHRDLAARNILVARDRRVAITDFGLSRKLDANDTYRMVNDTKLPWRTLAPELLLMEDGARVFTEKTDVWALGVTLWELATKRSAYSEFAENEAFKVLKQKIGNGTVKLDLTPIIMNHELLAPALVGCLNRDPTLRPTADQLRWLLKDDNSAAVTDRANYIAAVDGEYA